MARTFRPMRLTVAWMLLACSIAPIGSAQSAKEIRARIANRAAQVLQERFQMFPQRPDRPVAAGRTSHTLSFYYKQPEWLERIPFTQFVNVPLGRRAGEPQRWQRETRGEIEFGLQATSVVVEIAGGRRLPWEEAEATAERGNREREEWLRGFGSAAPTVTFRAGARDDTMGAGRVDERIVHEWEPKTFRGQAGAMYLLQHDGTRAGLPVGWEDGFYFQTVSDRFPKEIRAYVSVEGGAFPVHIQLESTMYSVGYVPKRLDPGTVTAILEALAGIALEELGVGTPEPVVEVAPPAPEPTPEPVPAPVPVPEPEPEPEPAAEALPPIDDLGAEDWLEEMDAAMRGIEDQLQGTLLLVRAGTELMRELQAEIARLQGIMKAERRQITDPLLLERTLEARREELLELVRQHAAIESQRDRAGEEATALLAEVVGRVDEIYATRGFGELDFHAFSRVLVARERQVYFEAQLALERGETDAALAVAERLQADASTRPEGLQVEALALAERGELVGALDTLRSARRQGYERTNSRFDEMQGTATEVLEREIELKILRALQDQATRERAMTEGRFQQWVSAHERVPPGEDPDSAYWMLHGAFWAGFSTIAEGALGALPEGVVGETTAEARSRDVGVQATDMAKNHVGIGMVYSLRKKGLTLGEIRDLDTAGLGAAMGEHFGQTNVDDTELRRRLALIKYAFQLDDMRALASGEPLVDGDVLSRGLRIEIADRGLYEKGLTFASEAGNVLNGTMVAMTFAPMARVTTSARHHGIMRSATAERAFVGVSTVGEKFAASRPIAWATERMAGTRLGTALLEGARATERFASRGAPQAAATFAGEMALDFGANWAVGRYLGEEAQILYDMFSSLGGADSATWARSYENLVNARSAARRTAREMRRTARVAQVQVAQADDFARRVRDVLETAGDAPPPAGTVRELRRELGDAADLPPEVSTKLENALDMAESGAARGARQSLEDARHAGSVIEARAASALKAADDLEELSGTLTDTGRRGTRGGEAVADSAPAGTVVDAPRARAGDADPPGTVIDEAGSVPQGGARTRVDAANAPSPADGAGTRIAGDAAPARTGPAGTRIDESSAPQPTGSGTRIDGEAAPADGVGPAGTRIDGAGAGTNVDGANAPSTGQGARTVPPGAAGAPGPSGAPPPAPPGRQRHVAWLDHDNGVWGEGDRLLRGQAFEEAADEYGRLSKRGDVDSATHGGLRQREDIARRAQAAKERRAARGRDPEAQAASTFQEGDGWLDEARRLAEQNGLGNEIDSATRPRPVLTESREAAFDRARELSQRTGRPIGETFPEEFGRASAGGPAWVKPVVDRNGVPHAAAEVLASRLRRKMGKKTPGARVVELATPEGAERFVATEAYQGVELWDHLKRVHREGHGGDVLGELLAYKDGFADDMSFSALMGDGDRHPSNMLVMPNGELLPIDFGMADIHRTHWAYRHEGKSLADGTETIWHEHWKVPGFDEMPAPDSPRFREYLMAQMQVHLDWSVFQLYRHLGGFGPGVAETFLSSFHYDDFAARIAQMRAALRDDVGSVVRESMDEFRAIAPDVFDNYRLDPDLTTKLLEARLDVMDEFFQTIDERIMGALQKNIDDGTRLQPIAMGRGRGELRLSSPPAVPLVRAEERRYAA